MSHKLWDHACAMRTHIVPPDDLEESSPIWDAVDDENLGDPAQALERRASLSLLKHAVDGLNERDQAIVRLRYGEARPFHEIGKQMGLSESRVRQLHKRIIQQLRSRLSRALIEVEAMDRLAGKRRGSAFIAEAVRERVRREELLRVLRETAGILKAEDYPHWATPEKVARWVRKIRRESERTHRRRGKLSA